MLEKPNFQVKRIYDPYETTDGLRVLTDRLWPRGVSKESAHVDHWAKDLTVSTALRRWFGHQPEKFDEFRRRYLQELAENMAVEDELRRFAAHDVVTLLYAARDTTCNHAIVLRDFLGKRAARTCGETT